MKLLVSSFQISEVSQSGDCQLCGGFVKMQVLILNPRMGVCHLADASEDIVN